MCSTACAHLCRAALLSARVGLERARATVNALQTIGLPAVVLTQSGRAIAANGLFQECARRWRRARERVMFARKAQAISFDAVRSERRVSTMLTGRSIAVPGDNDSAPLVAHLLPLRGAGRDIFSGASSLLFVTPVAQSKAPDVRLLEMLFDLAPAEARVAGLLVEGKSVEAIAKAQGITDNTVRMHLKSVFSKTGVNRQAQLVSLLALPTYGS